MGLWAVPVRPPTRIAGFISPRKGCRSLPRIRHHNPRTPTRPTFPRLSTSSHDQNRWPSPRNSVPMQRGGGVAVGPKAHPSIDVFLSERVTAWQREAARSERVCELVGRRSGRRVNSQEDTRRKCGSPTTENISLGAGDTHPSIDVFWPCGRWGDDSWRRPDRRVVWAKMVGRGRKSVENRQHWDDRGVTVGKTMHSRRRTHRTHR